MCVNPFSAPKVDTTPIQPPQKTDAEIQEAALRDRQRRGSAAGRSSTILAGDSAALNPSTGAARRTLLGEG
jgi:hypothetical protein